MGLLGRLSAAGRGWIARPSARIAGAPPPLAKARTPLFHPDVPVIVLWSEGAGRTVATAWFLAQAGHPPRGGESLAEAVVAIAGREGRRRELDRALRTRSHHVVKVVRDPLDRAASAFLALVGGGGQPAWAQDHWREAERWLAARGRDPGAGISFLDHLAVLAGPAARSRPGAFAPQHMRGEDETIDEVVPVERFAQWTEDAAPRLGLRVVDAAVWRPPARPAGDPAGTAALGSRPEAVPIRRGGLSDGRLPSVAALVNERSIPAIRTAYAPDFAAYGALYGL